MKTVKYKFMNEIQTHNVYSKKEMLELFKDSDSYFHYKAIEDIAKNKKVNEYEAEVYLNKTLDKLCNKLEDREYMHLEVLNMSYHIHDTAEVIKSLSNKRIWKNVIE